MFFMWFFWKKKKTEGYLKRERGQSIAGYYNTKSGFSLRLNMCECLVCRALSALFVCTTHTYKSPLGYRCRPQTEREARSLWQSWGFKIYIYIYIYIYMHDCALCAQGGPSAPRVDHRYYIISPPRTFLRDLKWKSTPWGQKINTSKPQINPLMRSVEG